MVTGMKKHYIQSHRVITGGRVLRVVIWGVSED